MREAIIAATATLLWVCRGAALAESGGPIVMTAYGELQGSTANGVSTFNGIPYAAPPVGALRWVAPQLPMSWSGVRQATAFGSACPQSISQFGPPSTDEDCVYLNVQAPATATANSKLPVMVWIHGGGFIVGEGSGYDASALVQAGDVIVVTLNYRLGLLGFMAHPALAAENRQGLTGNYGMLDQQAAIAWVKQNISGFGGNPAAVTIFGKSAGGQSVIDQLASATTPAVHAAIIESGAYVPALPTVAAAETKAEAQMGTVGCPNPTTAACLRALTVAQLLPLINPITGLESVSPVVDGHVLPLQPMQAYDSGQFQHVPVIDGSNHDEFRLFVALFELIGQAPYTPATMASAVLAQYGNELGGQALKLYPVSHYPDADYAYSALSTDALFACGAHLANALLAQYVPVYSYELTDPNPPNEVLPTDPNMPNLGDAHSFELPYLFPLLADPVFGIGPAKFTPAQLNLSLGMRASWTSFARYGRPLNPRGGVWLPYSTASDNVYSLNSATGANTGTGFVANHQCDFWKPLLLQEAGLPSTTPY